MGALLLLIASFAVILAGALMFTNAVEWLGHRLSLGEGATGSVLAAVGTAMPETLIPIVAIIGGSEGSEGVAVGAIIGAPFLLATLAMALVGASAYIFRARRKQGLDLKADIPTLDRDLIFFLVFFAGALLVGSGGSRRASHPARDRLRGRLLRLRQADACRRRRGPGGGDDRPPLHGPGDDDEPSNKLIGLQLAVGLGAIVGGAHLFVEEMIHVAESIGIEPLVLSLILAPLATELPEKINSFFWVREGKDSLALGNITGAMVFQSTIPVAFGLAFTDWELDRYAVVSACLGLAGGALAYFALRMRGRFTLAPVIAWAALFGSFLVYVLASS